MIKTKLVFDEKQKRILEKLAQSSRSKKLIIFDLDGTLTESRAFIDKEMISLIGNLLDHKSVAVIGGGAYTQFENQFLSVLDLDENLLENLFIFPTSGARFYRRQRGAWVKVYEYLLTSEELKKIMKAFELTFKDAGYSHPITTYGQIIENRGTQVTFSALGQDAPLEGKIEWNQTADRRKELRAILEKYLPEFEVRQGGLTSIDVTKKGIDKAFGVRQIMKAMKVAKNDAIFIGDALYEGGNDYAVKSTGIDVVEVSRPEETKYFIRRLLHMQ